MTQSRHGLLSFLLSLCLLGLAVDTSIPPDEVLEAPETGDLVDVEEGSHRQARWLGPDTDEALSPTSDGIDTEVSADKRQLRAVRGDVIYEDVDQDGQAIDDEDDRGSRSMNLYRVDSSGNGIDFWGTVAEFMLDIKFRPVKGCDSQCQAKKPAVNPCMMPVIIYPEAWCDFICCTPRPPPPPPPCKANSRPTPAPRPPPYTPPRLRPPPPPPRPPRPTRPPHRPFPQRPLSNTCRSNCDPCAPPCTPRPPCFCNGRPCPCRKAARRLGRGRQCLRRAGQVSECCDPC